MKKYSKLAISGFVLEIIGLIMFIYPTLFNNIDRAYGIWFMLLGGIFAQISFKYFQENQNLIGKIFSKITITLLSILILLIIIFWLLWSVSGTI